MRVIFPTRGGINRLSRLARLPARRHRQRILSIKPTPIREPSLVFAFFFPRLARALTDQRHGVPQRRKEKSTQISLRAFPSILYRIVCMVHKYSNVHLCTVLSASTEMVYGIIMQLVHGCSAYTRFPIKRILYLRPGHLLPISEIGVSEPQNFAF